jgi:glucan phosphoethanolaminetransferase (alkaline phosphatase superfamily)
MNPMNTLTVLLIVIIFLLVAFIAVLLNRIVFYKKVLKSRSEEIVEITGRMRSSVEVVECNLRDKDILLKKIIKEKNALETANQELLVTLENIKKDISIDKPANLLQEKDHTSPAQPFESISQQALEEFQMNVTKLEAIEKLYRDKLISKEEFEEKRKKLVDKIG